MYRRLKIFFAVLIAVEIVVGGSLARGEVESVQMLDSILGMKKNISLRIVEKQKSLEQSHSQGEKAGLLQELTRLDGQLAEANVDFERVATGVDISLFAKGKALPFNWKAEVLSLIEPGIMELKRVTRKARKKAKLKDELSSYRRLLPVARSAVENIMVLETAARNPELKAQLKALLPEWEGVAGQLQNKLAFLELELKKMEEDGESLIQASRSSIKKFFRTRGLFIFIAVGVCILMVFLLGILYRNMVKWIPGYSQRYRPFHIRVLELVYRVVTVLAALFSFVLVFYFFEDWVLLSLAVVILLGVGWTAKNTLPQYLHQSRLILNIGAVREGERLIYQGVPWEVKRINMFSILENPSLGVRLRVPIEALMGLASRKAKGDEPFFPCKKGDWVILSDGTRGAVVHLSHENVTLAMRGGARKSYGTLDFLGASPLNLSSNFRLKVPFGIGYVHQDQATTGILNTLETHLRRGLEREGHGAGVLNLRVEFAEASSSSLDLMVIADFKGSLAPLYNRLGRTLQRLCVDACTQNHWEIPYPQMVIHSPQT